MQEKTFAVYVMGNSIRTLYIGLTDDLKSAVERHKSDADPHAFTTRFHLYDLLYYELYSTISGARTREAKLRAMPKLEMLKLMEKMNTEGTDIFDKFLNGETPQVLEKERSVKPRKYKRKEPVVTTHYSLRSVHSSND